MSTIIYYQFTGINTSSTPKTQIWVWERELPQILRRRRREGEDGQCRKGRRVIIFVPKVRRVIVFSADPFTVSSLWNEMESYGKLGVARRTTTITI
ncbi:unnamed protein product [Linum trigynum]|uniref:Uncharacterized protein n=1 Tax=Linum trigynum TaxID=586398 RepID=A0AAV2ENS1_9ROSI